MPHQQILHLYLGRLANQASARAHTLAAPVEALISAPEAAQPNPQPVVESSMDSGSNGRLGAEARTNSEDCGASRYVPLAEVALNEASVVVATLPSARLRRRKTNDQESPRCASRRAESCARGLWRLGLGRDRVSLVLTVLRL